MSVKCGNCKKYHATCAAVKACCEARYAATVGAMAGKPKRAVNPWMLSHLAAELGYAGGEYTRRMARARVAGEFTGFHDPITCGNCGKDTAYMRPTVGAYMCWECQSMRFGRYDQKTKALTIGWTAPTAGHRA